MNPKLKSLYVRAAVVSGIAIAWIVTGFMESFFWVPILAIIVVPFLVISGRRNILQGEKTADGSTAERAKLTAEYERQRIWQLNTNANLLLGANVFLVVVSCLIAAALVQKVHNGAPTGTGDVVFLIFPLMIVSSTLVAFQLLGAATKTPHLWRRAIAAVVLNVVGWIGFLYILML